MLQKLTIALPQVKAGNISKDLLNEICQLLYSLYEAKWIAKKVYINIMNSSSLKTVKYPILVDYYSMFQIK